MSSVPKMRLTAAAFDEQPASLRKAAQKSVPRSASVRPQDVGHAHGQVGGPQRMPGQLALGQVQGGRQGGQQPRGGDLLAAEQAQPGAERRGGGRAVQVADDQAIGGERAGGGVGHVRASMAGAAAAADGPGVRAGRDGGTGRGARRAPTSCRRRPGRAPRGPGAAPRRVGGGVLARASATLTSQPMVARTSSRRGARVERVQAHLAGLVEVVDAEVGDDDRRAATQPAALRAGCARPARRHRGCRARSGSRWSRRTSARSGA